MKKQQISIICSIPGIALSSLGLIISLGSIDAGGFQALGIIFILPSLLALIITMLDFLIATNKINGHYTGQLIYSCFSTIVKIGVILLLIPLLIDDLKYKLNGYSSNLNFNLIVIALLIIISIPSILNITKLVSRKKRKQI